MENIPEDVLFNNIFIRLPAKQLAQLRCISKQWKALLSHSHFIRSHLHHSIFNNDKILLVFRDGVSYNRKPCSIYPYTSPNTELHGFIKLPINFPYEDVPCNVIGSINGLICFSCGSYSDPLIHIWNPSLSVVMTLPPFTIPYYDDYIEGCYFRFGYDPKTDDYKVVKVMECECSPEWLPVEVYSMLKDSWEFIIESFPSHVSSVLYQNEVCMDGYDGRVHWFGLSGEEENSLQTIIAFDLGLKTFSEIYLPDSIQEYNEDESIILSFIAGKLCVMSHKCEVWVMQEYGMAESWVKYHVFSQLSDFATPIGFTLYNEFVFGSTSGLALYDANTSEVKSFKGDASLHEDTKIVQYVDSLVWITPTKHVNTCFSICL